MSSVREEIVGPELTLYLIIRSIAVPYAKDVLPKTNAQNSTTDTVAEIQLIPDHCQHL